MSEVITIGLDIATRVFHVHGADERGRAVFSKTISRAKLLDFFAAQLVARHGPVRFAPSLAARFESCVVQQPLAF